MRQIMLKWVCYGTMISCIVSTLVRQDYLHINYTMPQRVPSQFRAISHPSRKLLWEVSTNETKLIITLVRTQKTPKKHQKTHPFPARRGENIDFWDPKFRQKLTIFGVQKSIKTHGFSDPISCYHDISIWSYYDLMISYHDIIIWSYGHIMIPLYHGSIIWSSI